MILCTACASVSNNASTQRAESSITASYHAEMKKCDSTANNDLQVGDLSTHGMNISIDKQISCYESIADKIIDRYYAEQSEQMKQHLSDYIKLSFKVSADTYSPDICTPTCGTMTTGMAYYDTLQFTKKYLDNLLVAVELNQ